MFKEFENSTYPEKIADKLIGIFSRKFSDPVIEKLDVIRILTGFYSQSVVTRKNMDINYFTYMREAALASGKLSKHEFYELMTTLPPGGYGEHLPIDEIAKKVTKLKAEGVDVGLKFGHYRRLTINHIFELVLAKKVTRHLVLIAESGIRTKKFKDKKIELTDSQRIDMFTHSCLVNTLGMTSGDDYSDDYYRGLVKKIRPTTLLIAESWPENVKREYIQRANSVGAEPYILPDIIGGMTTTKMEHLIFGR